MINKYLDAFSSAPADSYQLIGDCLLVEVLKEDEFKTKSGIILTDSSRTQVNGLGADKPTFVKILLVGEGYYDDETLEDRPLDSKPGDICLVGATSIKRFSVFGRLVNYGEVSLGLVRDSDIQMRFNGSDGFDRFFTAINAKMANS